MPNSTQTAAYGFSRSSMIALASVTLALREPTFQPERWEGGAGEDGIIILLATDKQGNLRMVTLPGCWGR